MPALALVPPILRNLLCRFVQPILISGEPNHFDGGKPFWRIRRGIAEWRQLADGHQNLNVMLCEAEQFGCRDNVEPCW